MLRALTLAALATFSTAALADGASDYAALCAACHGDAGAGDGAAAAALPVKPANFTDAAFWEGKEDAALVTVIKDGGAAVGKSPMMAAFGTQLSDDQVNALIEHIKTLKK